VFWIAAASCVTVVVAMIPLLRQSTSAASLVR
jgi:hypothetical protein